MCNLLMLQVLATLFVLGIGLRDWKASGESTLGQAHFESMMSNVKQIASKLGDIFDSPCGPQECQCSQDLCMPLLEDSNPSCLKSSFNTSNIYNCSNFLTTKLGKITPVCPSMMITTSRSSAAYVRTDVNAPALDAQQSAICRTQQLDPLFQLWFEQGSPYYVEYFVQTIGGGFRSYPGREENGDSCLAFEGRTRPWFSSMSVPNHLVVLIDCGYSMGGNADTWELDTRLTYAQTFGLSLVDTVYYDNYVNVFSFGGSDISSQIYETPTHVDFHSNNPQNHPELEPLKKKIKLLTVSQNDTNASDFENALRTALRALNETQNALSNVVIFTDGSFTDANFFSDPSITEILEQVVSSNVHLFIYGINAGISGSGLQTLSKTANSTYQNINNQFSNPLFSMQSYLGYLAACHHNLYGVVGFWNRNYKDYFNVGYALTVALPVFSKNGSFIGVASLDAVSDELGPDEPQNVFKRDFEAAVEAQRSQQDKVQAGFDAKTFLRPAVPAFFDDSSCVYNTQQQLLCSSQGNSKESLDERRCCNSCREFEGGGSSKKAMGIALGSVLGVIGLLVVVIAAAFCLRRYRNQNQGIQGSENQEESRSNQSNSSRFGPGIPTGTSGGVADMKTHIKRTGVIPSQVRQTTQQFATGNVEVQSNGRQSYTE